MKSPRLDTSCTPFLHTSAVAATCPPPHRRNVPPQAGSACRARCVGEMSSFDEDSPQDVDDDIQTTAEPESAFMENTPPPKRAEPSWLSEWKVRNPNPNPPSSPSGSIMGVTTGSGL